MNYEKFNITREWFESLSQKDMGIVTEVFNSLATEKELYDFDQGINGLL